MHAYIDTHTHVHIILTYTMYIRIIRTYGSHSTYVYTYIHTYRSYIDIGEKEREPCVIESCGTLETSKSFSLRYAHSPLSEVHARACLRARSPKARIQNNRVSLAWSRAHYTRVCLNSNSATASVDTNVHIKHAHVSSNLQASADAPNV